MRNRPAPVLAVLTALVLAGFVLAGCATSVAGRAVVAGDGAGGSTSAGRTLGVPNGSSTSRPTLPPSSSETTSTSRPTTRTTPAEPAASHESPTSSPLDVIRGDLSIGPNEFGYVMFQSPSANIACAIFDDSSAAGVRCDIAEHSYPDPPAQTCDFGDYGVNIAVVGADGPGVIGLCAGDTVADPVSPVLAYGENAGVGSFACHSGEEGVTCANVDTGHGFRLARAAYLVF